jgi:uncharacterized protein
MKLDLKRIAVTDGEALAFSYDTDLTDLDFNGTHPFATPVHIEGDIQNHLGVLKLHATIRALYETQCARCLTPVNVNLDVPCDMILSHDVQDDERDDIYQLEGDSVELDDIVIPALLLEVQMVYLCRPDCKGLCPTCGKDRNLGSCGCDGREIDSRLAVLQKLLEKDD